MSEFIHIVDKETGKMYEFVPIMRVWKKGKQELIPFRSFKEVSKRFRDAKPKDFKEKE